MNVPCTATDTIFIFDIIYYRCSSFLPFWNISMIKYTRQIGNVLYALDFDRFNLIPQSVNSIWWLSLTFSICHYHGQSSFFPFLFSICWIPNLASSEAKKKYMKKYSSPFIDLTYYENHHHLGGEKWFFGSTPAGDGCVFSPLLSLFLTKLIHVRQKSFFMLID